MFICNSTDFNTEGKYYIILEICFHHNLYNSIIWQLPHHQLELLVRLELAPRQYCGEELAEPVQSSLSPLLVLRALPPLQGGQCPPGEVEQVVQGDGGVAVVDVVHQAVLEVVVHGVQVGAEQGAQHGPGEEGGGRTGARH